MIAEIIIRNTTISKQYKFGQKENCDFLYKDGGIDWGKVSATHNTYTFIGQVGSSISSSLIKTRDVTIDAYAYYIPTDEEKRTLSYDELNELIERKIEEKKKLLNDLINPLHNVRIEVGNYYLQGKPAAIPKYAKAYKDNNECFCKFTFTIFCSNPMFKKKMQTVNVLSGKQPAFHFPLYFDGKQDVIMGTRKNYLMLVVENEGNAAVGAKIILKANGTVINPTIMNLATGEFIKINKTMENGERIVINTSDGSERGVFGELYGDVMNYLKYWDFDNTWMKFEAGSTILNYFTENGVESLLDVSIELNPEKYGLEGM